MSLITCYQPLPISFESGKGAWLYDKSGEAYLDGVAGIAVCGLGHAHPEIAEVIARQSKKLMHVSNGYIIEEQDALAEKLTRLAGMEQIFFANSGAEVNEAAIKIARLYGHHKHIETPSIIVMERAFHGRTMATLTASGSRKVQAGFEPLVPGFVRAPFNDLHAIKMIAEHRDDIVAVMIEPIQGEGGIHAADETYLRELHRFCEEQGWLLIFDEIQTANARTGTYFYYQQLGIIPDIVTIAKGLGNGIPIGACLMKGKACNLLKPGNHGSTFGGNPLVCSVASKVIEIIERDKLGQRSLDLGERIRAGFESELSTIPAVKGIRGKGLMMGIELDRPAAPARFKGLDERILINVTADQVIRLLPPLIISDVEADLLVERGVRTIKAFLT